MRESGAYMTRLSADPAAAASRDAQQFQLLREREIEIARAVAGGASNAEIAQ